MKSLLLALLAVTTTLPLHAQWRIALTHGLGTSYGDARDTSEADQPHFRADRTRTWELSLAHQHDGWRLGLALHRGVADVTEDADATAVVARNVLIDWGVNLELARRLAGQAGGPVLWGGVGAGFDHWTFDLDDRPAVPWRLSARVTAEGEVPISHHWRGLLRGELALGSSAFTADELPDTFVPKSAERIALFLGAGFTP